MVWLVFAWVYGYSTYLANIVMTVNHRTSPGFMAWARYSLTKSTCVSVPGTYQSSTGDCWPRVGTSVRIKVGGAMVSGLAGHLATSGRHWWRGRARGTGRSRRVGRLSTRGRGGGGGRGRGVVAILVHLGLGLFARSTGVRCTLGRGTLLLAWHGPNGTSTQSDCKSITRGTKMTEIRDTSSKWSMVVGQMYGSRLFANWSSWPLIALNRAL